MKSSVSTSATPVAAIFVYVWPEPLSSAAGVRTRALIRSLHSAGWKVHAVSPSGASRYREELEALGVSTHSCDPNSSPATDAELNTFAPQLVLFDRFVMEEQFGWRCRELWPNALQLVDTQDLHCVRRAREALVKAGADPARVKAPTQEDLGEDLLRELASLHRAGHALVVSQWEEEFLLRRCGFPKERVLYLPFPAERETSILPFPERSGFCFLGNFRHPPNLDSVRFLLDQVWPEIHSGLPGSQLHLYGAYPPAEISGHKGAKGVVAHGPVEAHRRALATHRVLLAPLRFGAGIKGKVLEAWACGTPVVGNAITFEGMEKKGVSAETPKELARLAVELHESPALWKSESDSGLGILESCYKTEALQERFLNFITAADPAPSLLGRMLRHHSENSTKYFSRWIEAKNKST